MLKLKQTFLFLHLLNGNNNNMHLLLFLFNLLNLNRMHPLPTVRSWLIFQNIRLLIKIEIA